MEASRSRLRWRCRRGVKEMDLLLQGFIERHYDRLSDNQKLSFDDMLDEADLDILAWIMDKGRPRRDDFNAIIALLRQVKTK